VQCLAVHCQRAVLIVAMLFEAGIILGAHSEAVAYPVLSGSARSQWPYLQLERTVSNTTVLYCYPCVSVLLTGNCMLKGKIDIDTSVPSVTARTTRLLSTTAVKPRTETGRSSNSNSFCQPCLLCRCTDRLELTAGKCRQLGHHGNF